MDEHDEIERLFRKQERLLRKQQRLSDESWAAEVLLWAAIIFVAVIFMLVTAVQALAGPSTVEGVVERWRDGDTPILVGAGERMPLTLWRLHTPDEGEPHLSAGETKQILPVDSGPPG